MGCQCCSTIQRKFWFFSVAILLCIGSIIMLLVWPIWSTYLMQKHLILENGTENYKYWLRTPVPIYLKFYLFNWSNPHELRYPHIKPHFNEMGPYVFLEKHSKENLTFYPNHTVSYYQRRTWHYMANASNGTLDDLITAPHIITAAVVDKLRNENRVIKKIINLLLNHEGGKLSDTKSVRQWIFDGYQDKLIDFLRLFNTTKIDMPYKRFGWMVDRNNSLKYDGMFTIHTGKDDINKLGMINHWNGRNETGFYPRPCGLVNGTAGDIFPPNLQSQSYITVFTNDACRYLNLHTNGSRTEMLGVETIKWQGTEETLDSGKNIPDQNCFCNTTVDECPKSGISNCKKCRHDAPIYASYPHFLMGDPSYGKAVSGLKPDPLKHTFFLAIEPITGIPVKVRARLQFNIMLTPDSDFDVYRNVPNILLPLFWFEESVTLNEELANEAKVVSNLQNYGDYASISVLCLGLVLLTLGVYLILTKKWIHMPEDDQTILINNSQSDDMTTDRAPIS